MQVVVRNVISNKCNEYYAYKKTFLTHDLDVDISGVRFVPSVEGCAGVVALVRGLQDGVDDQGPIRINLLTTVTGEFVTI